MFEDGDDNNRNNPNYDEDDDKKLKIGRKSEIENKSGIWIGDSDSESDEYEISSGDNENSQEGENGTKSNLENPENMLIELSSLLEITQNLASNSEISELILQQGLASSLVEIIDLEGLPSSSIVQALPALTSLCLCSDGVLKLIISKNIDLKRLMSILAMEGDEASLEMGREILQHLAVESDIDKVLQGVKKLDRGSIEFFSQLLKVRRLQPYIMVKDPITMLTTSLKALLKESTISTTQLVSEILGCLKNALGNNSTHSIPLFIGLGGVLPIMMEAVKKFGKGSDSMFIHVFGILEVIFKNGYSSLYQKGSNVEDEELKKLVLGVFNDRVIQKNEKIANFSTSYFREVISNSDGIKQELRILEDKQTKSEFIASCLKYFQNFQKNEKIVENILEILIKMELDESLITSLIQKNKLFELLYSERTKNAKNLKTNFQVVQMISKAKKGTKNSPNTIKNSGATNVLAAVLNSLNSAIEEGGDNEDDLMELQVRAETLLKGMIDDQYVKGIVKEFVGEVDQVDGILDEKLAENLKNKMLIINSFCGVNRFFNTCTNLKLQSSLKKLYSQLGNDEESQKIKIKIFEIFNHFIENTSTEEGYLIFKSNQLGEMYFDLYQTELKKPQKSEIFLAKIMKKFENGLKIRSEIIQENKHKETKIGLESSSYLGIDTLNLKFIQSTLNSTEKIISKFGPKSESINQSGCQIIRYLSTLSPKIQSEIVKSGVHKLLISILKSPKNGISSQKKACTALLSLMKDSPQNQQAIKKSNAIETGFEVINYYPDQREELSEVVTMVEELAQVQEEASTITFNILTGNTIRPSINNLRSKAKKKRSVFKIQTKAKQSIKINSKTGKGPYLGQNQPTTKNNSDLNPILAISDVYEDSSPKKSKIIAQPLKSRVMLRPSVKNGDKQSKLNAGAQMGSLTPSEKFGKMTTDNTKGSFLQLSTNKSGMNSRYSIDMGRLSQTSMRNSQTRLSFINFNSSSLEGGAQVSLYDDENISRFVKYWEKRLSHLKKGNDLRKIKMMELAKKSGNQDGDDLSEQEIENLQFLGTKGDEDDLIKLLEVSKKYIQKIRPHDESAVNQLIKTGIPRLIVSTYKQGYTSPKIAMLGLEVLNLMKNLDPKLSLNLGEEIIKQELESECNNSMTKYQSKPVILKLLTEQIVFVKSLKSQKIDSKKLKKIVVRLISKSQELIDKELPQISSYNELSNNLDSLKNLAQIFECKNLIKNSKFELKIQKLKSLMLLRIGEKIGDVDGEGKMGIDASKKKLIKLESKLIKHATSLESLLKKGDENSDQDLENEIEEFQGSEEEREKRVDQNIKIIYFMIQDPDTVKNSLNNLQSLVKKGSPENKNFKKISKIILKVKSHYSKIANPSNNNRDNRDKENESSQKKAGNILKICSRIIKKTGDVSIVKTKIDELEKQIEDNLSNTSEKPAMKIVKLVSSLKNFNNLFKLDILNVDLEIEKNIEKIKILLEKVVYYVDNNKDSDSLNSHLKIADELSLTILNINKKNPKILKKLKSRKIANFLVKTYLTDAKSFSKKDSSNFTDTAAILKLIAGWDQDPDQNNLTNNPRKTRFMSTLKEFFDSDNKESKKKIAISKKETQKQTVFFIKNSAVNQLNDGSFRRSPTKRLNRLATRTGNQAILESFILPNTSSSKKKLGSKFSKYMKPAVKKIGFINLVKRKPKKKVKKFNPNNGLPINQKNGKDYKINPKTFHPINPKNGKDIKIAKFDPITK